MQNNNSPLVDTILWPFILFLMGMTMVFYQTIGFDFSSMPGDLGDGRFNNYILEHGYNYITKGGGSYWNASFFFPEKNVISYSDNLFGALPIYVLCRFFADRETSFQLWYLILIGLNFLGSYYAIRKLNLSAYASSVGAFIYAFSLILAIQTGHIQMLPRFTAPFAIVSFYLWLHNKNTRHFYIALLLLVYQFYCSFYLGYFLLYIYIIMAAVYLIKERNVNVVLLLINTKKAAIRTSIIFCLVLCLMVFLFYPYYLRSLDGEGYPSTSEIMFYSPRIWNHFLVGDQSLAWGWSRSIIESICKPFNATTNKISIFVGGLPYVFLVSAFFMYRKDAMLRFFMITLLIIFGCTLVIYRVNLYAFVMYLIPGARSIRTMSRYITVAVFLWSIISAFFLDRFLSNLNAKKIVLIFILPFLLIIDNIYIPDNKPPLKSEFKMRSKLIVNKFTSLKHINPNAKAFALTNFSDTTVDERISKKNRVHFHIDAMMASLEIGLPCVNGYSAKNPPDYEAYFLSPDETTLTAWLKSNRVRSTVKEEYELSDILILK